MNPEPGNNSTPINMEQQHDALAPYMVSNLQQRRQLLRQLIRQRALITAHYGPQRSFLTTVLELPVTEESLVIDANSSVELMQQVAAADKVLCVTQLEQVRIQFILRNLELRQSGRAHVLSAPLPAEILRLQRRESFRLQVPLSHQASVELSRPLQSAQPLQVSGRLLDISIGGIGVLLPAAAAPIASGEQLDVRLGLPGQELISTPMRVCYLKAGGQQGDKVLYHAGLAFAEPDRGRESRIQRYIFTTERERKALEQERD